MKKKRESNEIPKRSKSQTACWVCGILFALSGLANLTSNVVGALVIILGGLVLIPPIKNILQEKTKLKSSIIIVIGAILILVGCLLVNGSSNSVSDVDEGAGAETSVSAETSASVEEEEPADESVVAEEEEPVAEPVVEEESVVEEAAESHIYDNAEIVDVMNGTNTEKVGEMSLIQVESSEITVDVLTDWYFNYVEENDYNYCLILYTDVEQRGCYSVSGYVLEGATLETNDYGLYMLADSSEATTYYPTEDGAFEVHEAEEEETEAEEETTETVTETTTEITVYYTDTGSKYHRGSCRTLKDSKHETTLEKAKAMGLEPCGICNPPRN